MRTVSSVAEVDEFFMDLEFELFDVALIRGTEKGLRETAEDIALHAPHNPEHMKPEEGNPWNLAASIGVDERIPAAKAKIEGLAERRDFQVKRAGDAIEGVIGYGMLYAGKVQERTGFDRAPLARSPRVLGEALEAECDRVPGRIGA